MVGVRTGKIAVPFAVFNILTLISRMAVTFQFPLLTKYVEHHSGSNNLLHIFNVIILVSGAATIAGAFLIPTFQRIFYKGYYTFRVINLFLKYRYIVTLKLEFITLRTVWPSQYKKI
ncbi:lipid II flippase family protein [Neobacillus kokaensis]|nr:DUF2837 family protein [Neobacillus kokaensis]